MKPKTALEDVFADLAKSEKHTDSIAAGMLRIVAEKGIRDVDSFNILVEEAYKANKWNPKPGRPVIGGEKLEQVPATVRTYVTGVRRALRRGINVAKMKTFYELRQELRANPVYTPARVPEKLKENLVGLRLREDMRGPLVQEIGFIYSDLLSAQDRESFERELREWMNKYYPRTKQALRDREDLKALAA